MRWVRFGISVTMFAERILIVAATILVVFASKQLNEVDRKEVDCFPQQVHLSFGNTTTSMVVMWSTIGDCSSEVHYGKDAWSSFDANIVNGTSIMQVDPFAHIPYIHRVELVKLKPNTTYYYTPVSDSVSSGPFFFHTPEPNEVLAPEFLIYGDLGIHAEGLTSLRTEVLRRIYTAIFHVGDFGYNLEQYIEGPSSYKGQNTSPLPSEGNITEGSSVRQSRPRRKSTHFSKVGDVFMQQIEEMAAHVPYMTAPGNHEIQADTFNHYRYRFSMPGTDWPIPMNKMWYSIDIGPVHFLSYSTEVFFTSDQKYVATQKAWIEADLNAANANRQQYPWIIALGHRPMYCSNDEIVDCTMEHSAVRAGFETLFYEYGVDLVLEAHEHSYERLWPMYKGVVLARDYNDPPAPVQIVTGAAGSKHGVDKMKPVENDWSAFRMDDLAFNSFGRLKVYNSTHLYWEQLGIMTGEVLDEIWVTQTTHGPFKPTVLQPEQKQKISEQIEKENVKSKKPSSTLENVTKAIKGVDTKVIIGVSFGAFVLVFLLIVFVVKMCGRRQKKTFRRWETLDYGKKFYTNVKSDEKEADDFEVDVNDGTTKLLREDGHS